MSGEMSAVAESVFVVPGDVAGRLKEAVCKMIVVRTRVVWEVESVLLESADTRMDVDGDKVGRERSNGRLEGKIAPTGHMVVYRILVLVTTISVVRLAGQWSTLLEQEVKVMTSVA